MSLAALASHLRRIAPPGVRGGWAVLGLALVVAAGGVATCQAQDPRWAALRLEDVDEDFVLQGEYVGERQVEGSPAEKWGLQVVALGGGEFQARAYPGGLPGDGWLGEETRELSGTREGDLLHVETPAPAEGETPLPTCEEYFEIDGEAAYLYNCTGQLLATLEKTERESPTLGAASPEGAVVLIGESADLEAIWDRVQLTEEGTLREGSITQQSFGDCQLHLEYQMSYMPYGRGQDRGNSGVYVQARYEVQLLDSFGRVPDPWDCAALYGYEAPGVNMCLPPLAWQTLDIEFAAARFSSDGQKISPAKFTIRHNGVLVHTGAELPWKTGYGEREGPQPGPLRLQDHGCPVMFRNVWLLEREDPLEELFTAEDSAADSPEQPAEGE